MRKVGLLVLLVAAIAVIPVAATPVKTASATIKLYGSVYYSAIVYSDWAETTVIDLTKAEDELKVTGIGVTTNFPGTWYLWMKSTSAQEGSLVKSGSAPSLTTAIPYTVSIGDVSYKSLVPWGGGYDSSFGYKVLSHTGSVTDTVYNMFVTHASGSAGNILEEGTYRDNVVVTLALGS